jgi:hypothetical protein
MSAIAIQSDQELIDSLTGLLNVIKNPTTSIGVKTNSIKLMNALLTKLSNTEHSSVVTSFALGIVTNNIDNLQRQNRDIPQHLETKRVTLSRNLIQSTQREAAAAAASAASAAATNAARCTGRGCFSRFFSSRVTPMPPTPIIYNPQPALAGPFRRTSKSPGQSRTPPPPSLPGAVMPLGGSRRVRRRTKHGQRVKHRRRTNRRLF